MQNNHMDVISLLFGLFSGTLSADDMSEFLHGAMKADFTAWSLKIAIVWWLMRGKVSGIREEFTGAITSIRKDFTDHFAKIEKGFSDMVGEMKELKESVTTELTTHSQTLVAVKDEVGKLTLRVTKLEEKKGED